MMRDWKVETEKRVEWIKDVLKQANAKGIVIGESGGKDCSIVSVLAKMATPNVLGVIMPCGSNLPEDREHALLLGGKFGIKMIEVDLGETFETLKKSIGLPLLQLAESNMKPRLRMTVLYAIAQHKGYLVTGTGNKSEITMGYFTKWGDGGYDFNPIADLTVTELMEYGRYLGVPEEIMSKAPSAGLWPGQTDEEEMGITYAAIDKYLLEGKGEPSDIEKIQKAYERTEHKRNLPLQYKG